MHKLIIILGPTAVGKTELSLQLAHELDTEIISGDSMQVYRYMDIGTAKIRPQERVFNGHEIKHYLIDILDPDEGYSVACFQSMAGHLIREINSRGRIPIVVGGTGFYLDSLCGGYLFPEEAAGDKAVLASLHEDAKSLGYAAMHDRLISIDPIAAANIHPHDSYRVLRALAVHRQTGLTVTEIKRQSCLVSPPYDTFICGLNLPREELYQRIGRRVEQMLADGLVDEVRTLLSKGYGPELKPMNTLGYKYICAYLNGEFSLEEAVRLLKRDTRHFAKRQLTWFNRNSNIRWFNPSDFRDNLKDVILQQIKERWSV